MGRTLDSDTIPAPRSAGLQVDVVLFGRAFHFWRFPVMKRITLLVLLLIAVLAGRSQISLAQDATAEVELATPSAGQCTVVPRAVDEIEALVGDIDDATVEVELETPNADAATPTPFDAPDGTPLPPGETATAITETVTQFYACQNANDPLRLFALMTDDYVVRVVESGTIDPAAFANIGTPATEMVASEQATIAVNGIVEIESGVYGVNVVGVAGESGEEFTDYLIVIQDGDRYLIDDLQNLG
jgi:hypothetical protein